MSFIEPAPPERIVILPDKRLSWSEERAERCAEMWKAGESAGTIANELGMTRNAVIGKVHRMGLHRRQRKLPLIVAKPARGIGGLKLARIRAAKPRKAKILAAITDLAPEIVPNPVNFEQLAAHHCRWPVDGAGWAMLYCGGDAVDGLPYCGRHCRLAYTVRAA